LKLVWRLEVRDVSAYRRLNDGMVGNRPGYQRPGIHQNLIADIADNRGADSQKAACSHLDGTHDVDTGGYESEVSDCHPPADDTAEQPDAMITDAGMGIHNDMGRQKRA
jgi:hypothetical protein